MRTVVKTLSFKFIVTILSISFKEMLDSTSIEWIDLDICKKGFINVTMLSCFTNAVIHVNVFQVYPELHEN